MYKIALTGGSGAGKGRLCRILRADGIPCLDTDALVHSLYESGESGLPKRLAAMFGGEILVGESIDRAALRRIVFADRQALKRLNQTVHAVVREQCLAFLTEAEKKGCPAAVIDAPQLFEAGMRGDFDAVVAVSAPEDVRIRRIVERDRISEKEAALRLRQQLPAGEYEARSDYRIWNGDDTDEEDLRRQWTAIFRKISGGQIEE